MGIADQDIERHVAEIKRMSGDMRKERQRHEHAAQVPGQARLTRPEVPAGEMVELYAARCFACDEELMVPRDEYGMGTPYQRAVKAIEARGWWNGLIPRATQLAVWLCPLHTRVIRHILGVEEDEQDVAPKPRATAAVDGIFEETATELAAAMAEMRAAVAAGEMVEKTTEELATTMADFHAPADVSE